MIKKSITYVCLLSLLFMFGACSHGVDARDCHGQAIRLHDYQGKWVFINYWAIWCKPCLAEISTLEKLYQAHKDKIVVLGVSDETLSSRNIRAIEKKLGTTFPMLSSFPLEKLGTNNISVLPMTFILDPQGKLYKVLKGPQSKQDFLTAINLTARARS